MTARVLFSAAALNRSQSEFASAKGPFSRCGFRLSRNQNPPAEARATKSFSRLQLEARGGQAVESLPERSIYSYDNNRHDHGCSQKHRQIPRIRGPADRRPQTAHGKRFTLKMKIFRDDAGVPGAARSRHHACYQVRKNS